ncbi:MAG: amino acid adenylation domain-containing protein [Flavobacteriales bacterium]|nr:amino acid adenylation domain-containing protein [Flavobacteriales bacterium]MCL4281052.1 amino acid adenylation domain-containing protein [Flavobacteriales bacterium]
MEKFIQEPLLVPVEYDPFTGPAIALTAPTTEPQREVWTASRISEEASCSYNESVSLDLKGPLDLDVLNKAVHTVMLRHESLRAVFDSTGTRMIVLEEMPLSTELHDLTGLSTDEQQARMEEVGGDLMNTPFDLSHGPLVRFIMFKLGQEDHVLRIVAHHIVCDGWSMSILIGDLSKIYAADGDADKADLPEAVAASRYAQEMNSFYGSPENEAVKAYWKKLFAAPPPQVDLPTDHARPWEKTWNAERIDIPMDPDLVEGLKRLGTRLGSSFVTTMLAVYEVLLARITGQRDLVVGMPAAGQSDMGMEELVGHCVALLPLRTVIDDAKSFSEYLKERRSALLDAFDNQRFTFSTLLRELNIPRDPGRVPLVPVIFNLDMEMDDRVAFPGIRHKLRSEPRAYEQFELVMNASSSGGALTLEWSFNTDLFKEDTVRGWMYDLNTLVRHVIDRPDAPLIELIEEGRQLAEFPAREWIGQASEVAAEETIATVFDRAARTHADRKALVQGNASLTYAELRDRVDALATDLIARGVSTGTAVAICAEPGFDLIIGMLAVVRAGGAFLPIDHALPQARIDYLMADSGASILLTRRAHASRFNGWKGQLVHLEDRPAGAARRPPFQGNGNDPAYLIYTSGSTGKPKGTVVPHRGILRIVHDQPFVGFGPGLTTLMHLSISFDACQLTVMGTLLTGGTMVLPASAKPVLSDFVDAIRNQGVNCLFSASGYFKLLVDEHLEDLKRLRYLVTGGDAISVPHVRKALRALGPGVVINVYGPTEATILATAYPVVDESWAGGSIPIGKPIGNTLLHVLDERGRPVRIGQSGELYIGGAGVALGYLGRPEQTAAHFLPDPFSKVPGAMMYRTGDMVYWNEDGELEYNGRVDDQVKVRGFRVELGEVEAALNDLPLVKDRVVTALPTSSGDKRLVLYVVPTDPAVQPSSAKPDEATLKFLGELEKHLAENLPEHMVPANIIIIPSMPINASGKPDKQRLPEPARTQAHMHTEHVAPRNELETTLSSIWGKLLGMEEVSVHDNFFEIGGHSLIGIQMLAHVERELGTKLPIKALFQSPTIAQLAVLLQGRPKVEAEWKNLSVMQAKGGRPPFFCVHGDEANVFIPRHLGEGQPFYAFFHQGEDGMPIPFKTTKGIAEHYIREMRQVRPHGPYFLGGYSFGGIVAFEMACQLAAAGEDVPLVALFDTYSPAENIAMVKKEQKLHEPLKRMVMRRLVKYYFDRGMALPPKLRHFHIIDTYKVAIEQYAPSMFPGRLTLIRTRTSPGTPDMGWGALAREGVEIRHVDGDHFTVIKEPFVGKLAEALRAAMDQALALASMA